MKKLMLLFCLCTLFLVGCSSENESSKEYTFTHSLFEVTLTNKFQISMVVGSYNEIMRLSNNDGEALVVEKETISMTQSLASQKYLSVQNYAEVVDLSITKINPHHVTINNVEGYQYECYQTSDSFLVSIFRNDDSFFYIYYQATKEKFNLDNAKKYIGSFKFNEITQTKNTFTSPNDAFTIKTPAGWVRNAKESSLEIQTFRQANSSFYIIKMQISATNFSNYANLEEIRDQFSPLSFESITYNNKTAYQLIMDDNDTKIYLLLFSGEKNYFAVNTTFVNESIFNRNFHEIGNIISTITEK